MDNITFKILSGSGRQLKSTRYPFFGFGPLLACHLKHSRDSHHCSFSLSPLPLSFSNLYQPAIQCLADFQVSPQISPPFLFCFQKFLVTGIPRS
ncbi:unnamed protein product [Citrullus colocynthis]|uniref:Uncharacterized protein n=1 Tax=Citrullus colocynthis TaxID=252529 RepID=A0ABP0YLU4_9ROSI